MGMFLTQSALKYGEVDYNGESAQIYCVLLLHILAAALIRLQ